MGRRADASRGVDGEADVTDIGEGGAAAMNPDANPDVEIVGPASFAEPALDGCCRLDGVDGPLEDREELVGTGVNLAAARP